MRAPILLLALAAPLLAQTPGAAPAVTTAVGARRPGISRQTFTELEKEFDRTLSATGGAHPVDILGLTRSVYLDDYGVVFYRRSESRAESRPQPLPPANHPGAEDTSSTVKKLENLPLLRKTMHDMVRNIAATMNGIGVKMRLMRPDAQVVLAVRLLYLPYENTTGLPGEIVMKADLKGALADNIKVEER